MFLGVCYVHHLGPGFDKLDPHATKCVFLGYSTTQKGYRCYSPVLQCYSTCADVTFDESFPYFPPITSLSDSSLAPATISLPLPIPIIFEPVVASPRAPLQVY